MAQLPLPGVGLSGVPPAAGGTHAAEPTPTMAPARRSFDPGPAIPVAVHGLMARLWAGGHAAYVVGGSLRDVLLGRQPHDWDMATDARPDRMLELFPGAVYENRFGTVAVREGGEVFEVTTFRSDHDYADFRRPHRIEFGDRVELDLARRDFTVNAIAWGADAPEGGQTAAAPAEAPAAGPATTAAGPTAEDGPTAEAGPLPSPRPALVDPFGGRADIEARLLRAVGDPVARFEEDALRMIRGVRLATTLAFTLDPATRAAIVARAELAGHLSGERVAAELEKLLAAARPSIGLDLLARTGLLAVVLPELAAQHGIAQDKVRGEDLWRHTLRTVDLVPAERPVVRLAALLHDVGKPATAADGRFPGHQDVGAEIAAAVMSRLRMPRSVTERVVHLVRHHMFPYQSEWPDLAVRRFIGRIGEEALDDLFLLRAADGEASGGAPGGDPDLVELRHRVDEQLAAQVALDLSRLKVDGRDLMEELGLTPGPALGRLLDQLLERVMEDPSLNERPTLLLLAQSMLGEDE